MDKITSVPSINDECRTSSYGKNSFSVVEKLESSTSEVSSNLEEPVENCTGKINTSTKEVNTADCTTDDQEETSTHNSAANTSFTGRKKHTTVATAKANVEASATSTKVKRTITAMIEKIIKKGRTKSDVLNHFAEILKNDNEDTHEFINCPVNHSTFKFYCNRGDIRSLQHHPTAQSFEANPSSHQDDDEVRKEV